MREVHGNLWSWHAAGSWIGITTNGDVRGDGACVMGRGTAAQAKARYPRLPFDLGRKLTAHGDNVPFLFPTIRILTYPVKHHWSNKACPGLIAKSAHLLMTTLDEHPEIAEVYLPRPGCGNGGLTWEWVGPTIRPILDNRVVIVDFDPYAAP